MRTKPLHATPAPNSRAPPIGNIETSNSRPKPAREKESRAPSVAKRGVSRNRNNLRNRKCCTKTAMNALPTIAAAARKKALRASSPSSHVNGCLVPNENPTVKTSNATDGSRLFSAPRTKCPPPLPHRVPNVPAPRPNRSPTSNTLIFCLRSSPERMFLYMGRAIRCRFGNPPPTMKLNVYGHRNRGKYPRTFARNAPIFPCVRYGKE